MAIMKFLLDHKKCLSPKLTKNVILMLVRNIVLNVLNKMKTVFTSLGLLGIIISSVIGFIFNCVVSIFITQLFLE